MAWTKGPMVFWLSSWHWAVYNTSPVTEYICKHWRLQSLHRSLGFLMRMASLLICSQDKTYYLRRLFLKKDPLFFKYKEGWGKTKPRSAEQRRQLSFSLVSNYFYFCKTKSISCVLSLDLRVKGENIINVHAPGKIRTARYGLQGNC